LTLYIITLAFIAKHATILGLLFQDLRMLQVFSSTKSKGLAANIVASVLSVLAINGIIFGLKWSDINNVPLLDNTVLPAFTPPGYAIGMVWTALFTLMGTARWQLNKIHSPQRNYHQQLIVFLILFCLAYPLYSLAINSRLGGLLGNFGTIGLALFVAANIRTSSKLAALLILPVVAWVTYATVILVAVIQARGW
jgi:translocator protein